MIYNKLLSGRTRVECLLLLSRTVKETSITDQEREEGGDAEMLLSFVELCKKERASFHQITGPLKSSFFDCRIPMVVLQSGEAIIDDVCFQLLGRIFWRVPDADGHWVQQVVNPGSVS